MKKAREVIEEFLLENEDTIVADCDAASLVVALREAGFVILPREPDEGMVEAARKYLVGVGMAEGYALVIAREIWRDMTEEANVS